MVPSFRSCIVLKCAHSPRSRCHLRGSVFVKHQTQRFCRWKRGRAMGWKTRPRVPTHLSDWIGPTNRRQLVSVCHKFTAEEFWSRRVLSGAREAVSRLKWEGWRKLFLRRVRSQCGAAGQLFCHGALSVVNCVIIGRYFLPHLFLLRLGISCFNDNIAYLSIILCAFFKILP